MARLQGVGGGEYDYDALLNLVSNNLAAIPFVKQQDYLAFDDVYHQLRVAIPNNSTPRTGVVLMSKASQRVFTFYDLTFQSNSMLLHLHTSLHTTTHFTVILAWASPTSLAVTKGIIVIFFSSA